MQIKSINYINFRNLKNNKLEFHPRFNLFMGKNGQGKTSILEAIYFSITGKSFRTKHIKELIKYDYQDADKNEKMIQEAVYNATSMLSQFGVDSGLAYTETGTSDTSETDTTQGEE